MLQAEKMPAEKARMNDVALPSLVPLVPHIYPIQNDYSISREVLIFDMFFCWLRSDGPETRIKFDPQFIKIYSGNLTHNL